MPRKLTTILLALFVGGLCVAASASAIKAFSIYANDMSTTEKKAQIRAVSGRACQRGGSPEALKVELGRKTQECILRTPVVGRDVEIIVTERLLSGTPRPQRRRTFLAVNLRHGKGLGRYQLAVFPLQRKYQLRKVVPGRDIRYLAVGKRISAIKGTNKANRIRLRAFNLRGTRDKDDCRLLVYVNGKRLAVVTDPRSGSLQGRETSFSAGAGRPDRGAIASFDNVKVRVPRPTF
jgi:hypothetical protein